MTNLLLIALEFPPIQAAGTFRPLRFLTHLPKFGIRPIVVTFDPMQLADGVTCSIAPWQRRCRAIRRFTCSTWPRLSRTGPRHRSSRRDVHYRGVGCASFEELFARLNATHAIDAIWATCPPFNVAGLALAARDAFDKPLIVDMRDAWSQWGSAPFRTWLHYRRVLRDEVELMNAADAVVCVTPQLAQMQWQLTRKPRDQFH